MATVRDWTSPCLQMRVPGKSLFHLVSLPVLHLRDLAAIPVIDTVVQLSSEMIILGPRDRTTT